MGRSPRPRVLIALLVVGGLAPLLLVAGAVALRAWVVEIFRVPQWGMYPTYRASDRLVVSKRTARVRHGDVILFEPDDHPGTRFVQRAIAGDGDVLEVRDGRPFINGWQVPSCVVGPDAYVDGAGRRHEGTLELELLHDEAYLVFHETGASSAPKLLRSRPGEWLVLGDNRDQSHDSRTFANGAGAGVRKFVGRPWKPAELRVPEALRGALSSCLARRGRDTHPPAPR